MFGEIFGSVLGYLGQRETNSANQSINQSNLAYNAEEAQANRVWSADQARMQRDYQTEMANTSWQRGVKDMQAAGLSPMLAYSKGGAISPQGAMGSSSAASATSPIPMQNVMSSAVDTANKLATRDLISAQTDASKASAGQSDAAARQLDAQVERIKAEIPKINQEKMNAEEQYFVLRATTEQLIKSAGFLSEQSTTQGDVRNQLKALVGKLMQETQLDVSREMLNRLEIDAATSFGNLGREAGQLKPVFDVLRMFIRPR
jgi:hypothetical protein